MSGSFDGAQVLSGLNNCKQQDANFAQQLDALKDAEKQIQAFLTLQRDQKSPALKQVLEKEGTRLRDLLGKNSDQTAALQKRLDEIQQWLQQFDGGAAPAQEKKGGAKAQA